MRQVFRSAVLAAAALTVVAVALPAPAFAWYRGGVVVGISPFPVIVGPPVVCAPPPYYPYPPVLLHREFRLPDPPHGRPRRPMFLPRVRRRFGRWSRWVKLLFSRRMGPREVLVRSPILRRYGTAAFFRFQPCSAK
jgi:hypothetical protein